MLNKKAVGASHLRLGHAGQSFQAPCFPAGMSKRMGAFYEKTGVSQHRTEPGFRDKNFSGRLSMFELE